MKSFIKTLVYSVALSKNTNSQKQNRIKKTYNSPEHVQYDKQTKIKSIGTDKCNPRVGSDSEG